MILFAIRACNFFTFNVFDDFCDDGWAPTDLYSLQVKNIACRTLFSPREQRSGSPLSHGPKCGQSLIWQGSHGEILVRIPDFGPFSLNF